MVICTPPLQILPIHVPLCSYCLRGFFLRSIHLKFNKCILIRNFSIMCLTWRMLQLRVLNVLFTSGGYWPNYDICEQNTEALLTCRFSLKQDSCLLLILEHHTVCSLPQHRWKATQAIPFIAGDMTVQCHYCTHYSSAIIVASYLVRMPPFTQAFCSLQVSSLTPLHTCTHTHTHRGISYRLTAGLGWGRDPPC